jgi:glycosyltransferase involved in cell wall biosynthesis
MNILFLGNKGDFHVDAWTKYFIKNNSVHLFSENSSLLKNRSFKGVKVHLHNGLLGLIINFFKIDSKSLLHFNKLVSIKIFANHIRTIILKESIDIIHCHSLFYGFLSSFVKTKVPIIFTPMGSDIIIHAHKNRFYNYMAKRTFNACQIVTGDSKLIQRKGIALGASKLNNYVIQNGVDSNIFFPENNSIKKKFGLSKDDLLLFSPRAIDPLYNIDIIIDSIAILVNKKINVKCMFSYAFGDNYLQSLKSKVEHYGILDNIIWLGYLSYEQMAKFYNAADIIISIPKSDSSPRSVYEGMFCEKPVIVSDLEWSHEFLEKDSVYRIKTVSGETLSSAIEKLNNNKNQSLKISNNAKYIAKKYFEYDTNMQKMETVMKNFIKNQQS